MQYEHCTKHTALKKSNPFESGVCSSKLLFTERFLKPCSLLCGKYSYRKWFYLLVYISVTAHILSPLRDLSKQDVSFSWVAPINIFSFTDDVRIICRWRNGRMLLPSGKHWNGGLNHVLIPLSQRCFKGIGCKFLQKYFFTLFCCRLSFLSWMWQRLSHLQLSQWQCP